MIKKPKKDLVVKNEFEFIFKDKIIQKSISK